MGLDTSDVVFGAVDDKVIDAGRNPAAVANLVQVQAAPLKGERRWTSGTLSSSKV